MRYYKLERTVHDVVVDLEDYKADASGTNVKKVRGGRNRRKK